MTLAEASSARSFGGRRIGCLARTKEHGVMRVTPELVKRFPHMFSGEHGGRTLFRGWSPILAMACEEIQLTLEGSGVDFSWFRLALCDGEPLFLYLLGAPRRFVLDVHGDSRCVEAQLLQGNERTFCPRLDGIVRESERIASQSCIVCGAPAPTTRHFGVRIALCGHHSPEILNSPQDEGLEGVWREAIEWEDLPPPRRYLG